VTGAVCLPEYLLRGHMRRHRTNGIGVVAITGPIVDRRQDGYWAKAWGGPATLALLGCLMFAAVADQRHDDCRAQCVQTEAGGCVPAEGRGSSPCGGAAMRDVMD
jgi:hypothetical protein